MSLNAPCRTRVRLFGLATVIFSLLWCFAAHQVYKHILHLEFMGIMAGGIDMNAGARVDLGFLSGFVEALEEESVVVIPPVAFIEATAICWLGLMWCVGLLLLIGGAMAQAGRSSGRRWLLCAGTGILASTALTFLGMYVLIRWGAFPPTVKPLGYFVVALVQSGYGWVLLIWHFRKPAASKQVCENGTPATETQTPERVRGLGY